MQAPPGLMKVIAESHQRELRARAERSRAQAIPRGRRRSTGPVGGGGAVTILTRLRSAWLAGEHY